MQDFRKLVVWQHAHEFVMDVYRSTANFPSDERFGLTSQIRRATVSIPANIAEGCGRETTAELKRFLYIAMGSASEVDYFLQLTSELGFLGESDYQNLSPKLASIKRMLNAFIQKVKQ